MDENGTQTWTLYDGSDPIMDFSSSGSLEMRYLNGPAGDLVNTVLARQSASGTVAWYLPDRLGTIRDLIDNSGAIIDHVDYSAFGTVLDESSPSNGDRIMGFAGLERDSLTGLNLAANRVEDPGTRRWTSQDPLGYSAGDMDVYRYVGNGPTDAADPSGLQMGQKPAIEDLMDEQVIQDWMTYLLRLSKEGTANVHEEGAWIFWNKKTGKIRIVKDKPNKVVKNGKGRAHIFFGIRPSLGPDCELIGMIHTHPDPDEGGFFPDPADSPPDTSNQRKYKVPWIVPTREHGVYILNNGTSTNDPTWKPNPNLKLGPPLPTFTPK